MAEYPYLAIIWCGKIFVPYEEYIPLQNLNKQTNPDVNEGTKRRQKSVNNEGRGQIWAKTNKLIKILIKMGISVHRTIEFCCPSQDFRSASTSPRTLERAHR